MLGLADEPLVNLDDPSPKTIVRPLRKRSIDDSTFSDRSGQSTLLPAIRREKTVPTEKELTSMNHNKVLLSPCGTEIDELVLP